MILKILGNLLKIIGGILYIGGPLIAIWLTLKLITNVFGFMGIIIFIITAPVAILVAPVYAFFAYGDLSILIYEYGGFILGMLLAGLGSIIEIIEK